MRTQFRLHDGVRICHLDFSHVADEEEAPITDVTGSRATPKLRAALQDLTAHNKKYVVYGAVVGVTSIQRAVLRGIILITGRRLIAAESTAAAVAAIQHEARKA